jgi:hypothetical protein
MSTIQVESKQKNKKKDKEGQIPKKEELKVAPVLSLKINLKHGAKPNTLFAVDKLQTDFAKSNQLWSKTLCNKNDCFPNSAQDEPNQINAQQHAN